ncbi:MAG: enolase C-terminal domain-like protein [Vicinamibacterales bacterium]
MKGSPSGPRPGPAIGDGRVSAYTVPTSAPESDGTFEWTSTTIVIVELDGGGMCGLGYTYADASAAEVARDLIQHVVRGRAAFDVGAAWQAMVTAARNMGRPGIASTAIAAVDTALWDLKARLLGLPLAVLLGQVRDRVPIYGSGGFTSQSIAELTTQLSGWAEAGIPRVKMKVGRCPAEDPARVAAARRAIGEGVELMVDANGAFTRRAALAAAERFAGSGVAWFEEPVSSEDLEGLRWLRDRGPSAMAIAAGEYVYDRAGFHHMLRAGAVDTLQADLTRCGGVTGFVEAAVLAEAWDVPLSAHTAPAIHLHPGAAVRPLVHLEYFHDHVRIERRFFDGVPEPDDGALRPDPSRPGHGLVFKRADAAEFAR